MDARLAGLLSPAEQASPFDRLGWWQGLAEHCGVSPMVAVARDGDALAVLPLAVADGHFAGLANWYTFRLRPLISHGADRQALLRALARDLTRRTHRIVLSGIPDEDGSATALTDAFQSAGWLVLREQCDTNHVLPVRGRSWEEYLGDRPGKLRTTLKRKSGKLDCRISTHFDEDTWRGYEAIYRQSWKPEEGSPAFLRDFALQEGAAGRLRLGLAYSGNEPVAGQMWTVEGQTALIHKLAHSEEARSLSPGSVLSAALFRHVIDTDKVDLVDFGTGDDPYKRDWMEEFRPRYRLEVLRPLEPRNWLLFAKAGLRRLAGRHNRG